MFSIMGSIMQIFVGQCKLELVLFKTYLTTCLYCLGLFVGVPPKDGLLSLVSIGIGNVLGGATRGLAGMAAVVKGIELPSRRDKYRGLYCSTLPLRMLGPTKSDKKARQCVAAADARACSRLSSA